MFHKYPSIGKLKDRKKILTVAEVIATEKLHGANFRLRFIRGIGLVIEVEYGSRDIEFGRADSELSGKFYDGKPVAWFTERPWILAALIEAFARRGLHDVIVFGEVCGTSIQNGVLYLPRHEVMFRAFDIQVGNDFLSYDDFVAICDEVGLPRVPEIYRGKPSKEIFDGLLEKPSAQAMINGIADGCNISEGVVIRSNPLEKDHRGAHMVIKHKSIKFDECVRQGIEQDRVRLGPTVAFARSVVTIGRMLNVRGHLRDVSTPFTGEMKDMQWIGPSMLADIHKECQDDWDQLVGEGFLNKEVEKAVKAQASDVYASLLAEENPPAGGASNPDTAISDQQS